jgi:surfeit locus 1 family protein
MLARLRHYRFDWKLSLLTGLLLPLLLSLGFWQLQRAQEKLELQEQYSARQNEAPVSLEQLSPDDDLQYRQVELTGRYDNAHNFLLDNRIHQGRAGYDLITPFITEAQRVVLVNRGWLAQGPTRAQLPPVAAIEGDVTVRGSVYVPVGMPLVLGSITPDEGWPQVIQTLEPGAAGVAAGHGAADVFPYSVRLAEGAPGVLVRDWPVISMTPERHHGYAVQWFAMAAMLLGLYLFYSTRPSN